MCSGGAPVDARGSSTEETASPLQVLGMTGEKATTAVRSWPALMGAQELDPKRSTKTFVLRTVMKSLLSE
jgi:hypothetical protein